MLDFLMDTRLAIVILIGLPIGIMFRAARLIGDKQPKDAITRDLIVSLLISGANFVLAATLAVRLDLNYLEALLAAVVIGATGVKALLGFTRWAFNRLVAKDFDEWKGNRRQDAQKELSRSRLVERDLMQEEKKDGV